MVELSKHHNKLLVVVPVVVVVVVGMEVAHPRLHFHRQMRVVKDKQLDKEGIILTQCRAQPSVLAAVVVFPSGNSGACTLTHVLSRATRPQNTTVMFAIAPGCGHARGRAFVN